MSVWVPANGVAALAGLGLDMVVADLIDLIESLPDVRRTAQASTPEFRVSGKIFATLPSQDRLLLNLTPHQQAMVLRSDPEIFVVVEGAWGERGWTYALIPQLDEATALSALMLAWTSAMPAARASTPSGKSTGSR